MALETIALSAIIGGGVVGAGGSIYEGNAKKAAADYNVEVANRNSLIALQQADADAEDKRRENRRFMSGLVASFGASGLSFAESGLDAFEDAAAEAELDVRRIQYGGLLKSMGYQDEAKLQKFQGKVARTAGYIGAVSQVTNSVGSAYRLRAGGAPRATD